jgi:hypothetical protein
MVFEFTLHRDEYYFSNGRQFTPEDNLLFSEAFESIFAKLENLLFSLRSAFLLLWQSLITEYYILDNRT